MAVMKRGRMDIIVKNEQDRQRVLSILNNTDKPSQSAIDRFTKAMQIKVEEKFVAGGR